MKKKKLPENSGQPPTNEQPCYPLILNYTPPEAIASLNYSYQQGLRAQQDAYNFAFQNYELRRQLYDKTVREMAYTDAQSTHEGLITFNTSGHAVRLLNCGVEFAAHVKTMPPLAPGEIYLIRFSGKPFLHLSVQEFSNDLIFLQKIEELPDVSVVYQKSRKKAAELIRHAINEHMENFVIRPYAGWGGTRDGSFKFWAFSPFSTHLCPAQGAGLIFPQLLQAPALSEAANSGERFLRAWTCVRNPRKRGLLLLWFHCAALISLLQRLGHPIPMALYLFVDDNRWNSFLKSAFGWFGDEPLSLDDRPDSFARNLTFRKDQPALILDQRHLEHAAVNSKVCREALITRKVQQKAGREPVEVSLQALLTILSTFPSALSCAPGTMVLELSSGDLDVGADAGDLANTIEEHLRAFLSYAAEHIPDLKSGFDRRMSSSRLDDRGEQTYSAFAAVADLLTSYFEWLGCSPDLWKFLEDLTLPERLLAQSCDMADSSDLAEQFVAVTRSLIQSHRLHPYSVQSAGSVDQSTLLFDEGFVYLPSPTFKTICRSLDQSRPVIIRALAEAGYLTGKSVNSGTLLTRVNTYGPDGKGKVLQVFRMPREIFDRIGDPLVLDGGEM